MLPKILKAFKNEINLDLKEKKEASTDQKI